MSVGQASDIQAEQPGFEGQASPSIPSVDPAGFPMDEADAALTEQDFTSEPASEGAEAPVFTDDDLAFLQSDEVRQYLSENVPDGFLSEGQHEERLRKFQSAKDSEIANLQRQSREQLDTAQATAKAQAAALVSELYRAWQEQGLDEGSDEWNQRMQRVLQSTQAYIDRDVADRSRQNTARTQLVSTEAQKTYEQLRAIGVELPQGHQGHQVVRQYLTALRNGEVADDQLEASRWNVIQYIMGMQQQGQGQPQQQQPPAQQPAQQQQAQPQQPVNSQQPRQQRPNPGPMRSARGGGGGAPRTVDELYEEGKQKLIEKYGGWEKVPQADLLKLDIDSAVAAAQ